MVFLVDTYPYKPDEELRVDYDSMVYFYTEWLKNKKLAGDENANDYIEMARFAQRIYEKSGLSDQATYMPRNLNPVWNENQPVTDLNHAMQECSTCIFGAMEGLMRKTGLQPRDIDIVVTTCSIFCPTPSMASMLVNHFKLRSNIQAYHLGGMGCSNGVTALNLVRDLLKARPNSNAVFVTTETLTPAYYAGRDRSRLLGNVIFRMGGCATLISNKKSWGEQIKYKLITSTRAHGGASDAGYRCIWQGPDDEGLVGVHLSKEVAFESGKTLTKALTVTAPKVMTWKQIGDFIVTELKRRMGHKVKRYKPQFSDCLQHFLIHAGGAKILDVLAKELNLNEYYMKPSYSVLRDYGNVSSSTTWYSLAWLESCRGVRKGDKVLQIGIGSGVKAGVAVWQAVKDIVDVHDAWAHHESALKVEQGTAHLRGAHGAQHFFLQLIFLVVIVLISALLYRMQGNGAMVSL